jgi:xanthine dehydrogenase accessory factor
VDAGRYREKLVLIRGAGDLASGVAHRLRQAHFPVVMLEIPQPTVIRRTVAFATAAFTGSIEVEGIRARKTTAQEVEACLARGEIPLLIDPQGEALEVLRPEILVDAVMAKKNALGTNLNQAPLVIGLGPGFTAGKDVHGVVETQRGHDLGRVLWEGKAHEDTGVPGEIAGYSRERLVKAPAEGIWEPVVEIGDVVAAGDLLARVGRAEARSEINGVVRGLLYPGLKVHRGMKAGDVDPRGRREYCFTISDKARAIAGGVLEAILHAGVI